VWVGWITTGVRVSVGRGLGLIKRLVVVGVSWEVGETAVGGNVLQPERIRPAMSITTRMPGKFNNDLFLCDSIVYPKGREASLGRQCPGRPMSLVIDLIKLKNVIGAPFAKFQAK
jgi:hypothetical protein